MQGVRFLLEFAKADERLRQWGVRTTIVVLGSARIREANGHARGAAGMVHWYDESRRFGRIVSERGGALAPIGGQRDNVIATGGGPGIMEAANRGASDVGAPSIGFNIELPREQEPNPYSTPELTFQFHSSPCAKSIWRYARRRWSPFPADSARSPSCSRC
jgi:predicted Rossmann-fold nucleotide-binding protein